MRKIWKYQLNISDDNALLMPQNATVLKIDVQDECITLWALVAPEYDKTMRRFEVKGTGQAFDASGLTYLDSVQMGPFVWHVFEKIR